MVDLMTCLPASYVIGMGIDSDARDGTAPHPRVEDEPRVVSPNPHPSARSRREFLLASASALVVSGCSRDASEAPRPGAVTSTAALPRSRLPALFLAHGSPLLLDDVRWKSEFLAWGNALGKPRAVLMLSAHWTRSPVRLGAEKTVPLVYDFSGFPQRYYDATYAAPGAPLVASRVRELLEAGGQRVTSSERGLDHGVWVPLSAMYPAADVPVLQVSLPSLDPKTLFALGERLAPLRDEGVLVVGSGFLTHNLRALDASPNAAPPSWAHELDAFCKESLAKQDIDALLDYRARAPGVAQALPTHEHFVPLFVALGAARGEGARFPIEGFTYGSFTKRSVQLGAA